MLIRHLDGELLTVRVAGTQRLRRGVVQRVRPLTRGLVHRDGAVGAGRGARDAPGQRRIGINVRGRQLAAGRQLDVFLSCS